MNKKRCLSILGVAAFTAVVALNVNAGLRSNDMMDEAWSQSRNPVITCDKSNCYGRACHRPTGNYTCPCSATGRADDYCMYDGK